MKKIIGSAVALISAALAQAFGLEITDAVQAEIVNGLVALVGVVLLVWEAVQRRTAAQAKREGGFARADTLVALAGLLLLFAVLALPGCGLMPETPRQAIAASYITVETLAETAEVAHRDGHIDDQQRAVIRADLQTAMNALREARQIEAAGGDPQDRLQYARSILVAIQSLLPEVPANE